MHRVHAPHAILVPVVVEFAPGTHPVIPRSDPWFHIIQGKDKPELAQIVLHVLRHPILVQAIRAHAETSFNRANRQGEVSAAVTTPSVA